MLQPSDEIKSKIDIVDLVRDYVPLKKAGMNFSACCPFHREKTPSFIVSPEKQIWHCFGCGKGGDIFSFIMEAEGVDFVEALRILAPKAGVTLKRQDPKLVSQRNRLLDINELARKYYHKMLLQSDQAEVVRKYLAGRGLTQDTIEEWQIGCSPDSWDTIYNLLKGRGYNENEIFLAGLIVKRDNRPGFYDRFRGRIMFPINDVNGNTVAFSARVSPEKEAEEKMGKYINSPQTMIYDKSGILFGLDKARQNIKRRDMAIIVEGQMDTISAHQRGFNNVVAASSTALTGEHVRLLKRYSLNIALAFDMDEAGVMAVDRGVREAMAAEMNIKVIELPEGKDPDECIRKNPEGWKKAVNEAKPMMQYYFDKILKDLDLSVIDDRRLAAKNLLPLISKLGNKIEQDFWLKKLSEKIDVTEKVLRETLAKGTAAARPRWREAETASSETGIQDRETSRMEKLSALLLALVLKYPSLLEYTINHIQIDQIENEQNQGIYRNLIFYYNNIINTNVGQEKKNQELLINYSDFKSWLQSESEKNSNSAPDQLKVLDRLVLLGEQEFEQTGNSRAKDEAIKIVMVLRKNYLVDRMKEMERLIVQAEKTEDRKAVQEFMEELKILSDELRDSED